MTVHSPPATLGLRMPLDTLDALMPMHLSLDRAGRILHAGPTIRKMMRWAGDGLPSLFDHFELRRPQGLSDMRGLLHAAGSRLSLALIDEPHLPLRGVLLPLDGGEGAILDISLGLSFAKAVADFALTLHDFSPCDQTVELLYLHEANNSTARLSRHLSERLQAAHAAAQLQARTDVLTGLSNRRAIDAEITRLLADRSQHFTLLQIDLDRFKQVNDSRGHAAGDTVLTQVGEILARELRRNDLPARFGGDEFLVVLRPGVSREVAASVAQRLIERIEEPIEFEGEDCSISASIGIVMTNEYGERPDIATLIADVDAALYAAKNGGRGRFAFHVADAA